MENCPKIPKNYGNYEILQLAKATCFSKQMFLIRNFLSTVGKMSDTQTNAKRQLGNKHRSRRRIKIRQQNSLNPVQFENDRLKKPNERNNSHCVKSNSVFDFDKLRRLILCSRSRLQWHAGCY